MKWVSNFVFASVGRFGGLGLREANVFGTQGPRVDWTMVRTTDEPHSLPSSFVCTGHSLFSVWLLHINATELVDRMYIRVIKALVG